MSKTSKDIRDSSSESLSDLLGINAEGTGWDEEELGEVLEHQLSAPLQSGRESAAAKEASDPAKVPSENCGASLQSFRDLLHHPSPPLEFLKRTKRFARDARMSRDGPIPDEVAAVLYYACILVAANRCGECISALSVEDIQRGVREVLKCAWLGDDTRDLLRTELRAFSVGAKGRDGKC